MFQDTSELVGGFILVLAAVVLVLVLINDKKNNKKSSIPGLKPRIKSTGNLQDIKDAGTLHEFLVKLHKDVGAIAGFWLGEEYVVSTASPVLWKDIQGLFDRPVSLFKLLEPLFGKHAIHTVNGHLGRKRHKMIASRFTHECMERYYNHFITVSENVVTQWEKIGSDEQINLKNICFSMSIRDLMLSIMGPYFKDEKKVEACAESYFICWSEIEKRLDGVIPAEGSERDVQLKVHSAKLKKIITDAIKEREKITVPEDEKNLTDLLLASGYDEEIIQDDLMITFVGGFHTSALLMTWSLYFMAKHPEIQEKVYQEIKEVMDEETITPAVINQLVYTKQVLDETLRCAMLVPWAARVSDVDMKIGEYIVPKHTPVLIALGVVHQDPEIWSEPNRFDPNRFEKEEMKKKPPFTFEPFGIGKRKCPAYRFSSVQAMVIFSILMRRFKFHLVKGQDIQYAHGLVTHPDKDIYVTISKR